MGLIRKNNRLEGPDLPTLPKPDIRVAPLATLGGINLSSVGVEIMTGDQN